MSRKRVNVAQYTQAIETTSMWVGVGVGRRRDYFPPCVFFKSIGCPRTVYVSTVVEEGDIRLTLMQVPPHATPPAPCRTSSARAVSTAPGAQEDPRQTRPQSRPAPPKGPSSLDSPTAIARLAFRPPRSCRLQSPTRAPAVHGGGHHHFDTRYALAGIPHHFRHRWHCCRRYHPARHRQAVG